MEKMLTGVRVLDITQAYSGPFCTMHLADHGAEVIKVESLAGEQTRYWGPFLNGYSGYFATLNRNKKGIALDLKSEGGKEALKRLIAVSDVVVENFRVGVFERLGFSWETLQEINPKIIYASVSGFGLTGPKAKYATYDNIAQAESGLMSLNGTRATGPLRTGPSLADAMSGTYLSLAIMMALYNRTVTGKGSRVDVAMCDAMFATLENYFMEYSLTGNVPESGFIDDQLADPWGVYQAEDGAFAICCGTAAHFEKLARLMGREDMIDDPRLNTFKSRRASYLEEGGFREIFLGWLEGKTLDDLEAILVPEGIPFGRVQSVKDCAESEQTKLRNMVWEVDDPGFGQVVQMTGTPMKFDREEDAPVKGSPLVGEDNDEILTTLAGFSVEEVEAMREKGEIK